MIKKFSHQVALYQKLYRTDERGGKSIEWKLLGFVWAHLAPYKCTYPFSKEGQKNHAGIAYDVIVRNEAKIFKTDKIVWRDQDHFFVHSPQQLENGYLKLRIFSWKKSHEAL